MFKYLKGRISDITENYVSLEVGDVGYEINILKREKFLLNEIYKIFVYDFISPDNENIIYGFLDYTDLIVFKKLLLVNGIGAKTAQNILSKVKGVDLISFIISNKIKNLKTISGIGNKAEIVVHELKSKFKEFDCSVFRYQNVKDALFSLGYKDEVILEVVSNLEDNLDDETALKRALKIINNG